MKLEDLVKRAEELAGLGSAVLATKTHGSSGWPYVDSTMFAELETAALSFVQRTFGTDSPYYKQPQFDKAWSYLSRTPYIIGALKACRDELAGGWVFTTRGLVSAEVFSDFLSMAEHLLGGGYKDAAAVMIGSVLEEHLRQLCQKHSISITIAKPDGTLVPLKADALNSELARAGVYSKLDHKNMTAWLDLRNKAAHGKYGEYTLDQVDLMLRGVTDFIVRTPL
jgi:hypothetical protein